MISKSRARLGSIILASILFAPVALSCGAEPTTPAPDRAPPPVSADLTAAAAGTYALDSSHTSIIARVPHFGFSHNVFRFGDVTGTLTWDPVKPEASTLKISVSVASIQSPVPDHNGAPFSVRVGKDFLKDDLFPSATFDSTAFHKLTDTTGTVDGNFTFLGVTRPLTLNVTLIGAGKNIMGKTVIGIYATGAFDPLAFGASKMVGTPTDLLIDAEFDKQ